MVMSPAVHRFPTTSPPVYGQEAKIREVKVLARAHTAERSENRFEPQAPLGEPSREAASSSVFSGSLGGPAAGLSFRLRVTWAQTRGWKGFYPPTAT